MAHFNDHQMTHADTMSLLRRVRSQVTDARTRFVRANTALKGLYCEAPADDDLVREQIVRCMARLCAVIDTIDGKVVPEDRL